MKSSIPININSTNMRHDPVFITGLISILVSLLLFCIPLYTDSVRETFGLFILHQLITVLYLISLLASGVLRKGRDGIYPLFLFLVLFLVSAFALNREMNVFETSADWFSVLLVVLCMNYIAFGFRDVIPGWLLYPMYFLLGAGFVTFLYLSVYLISFYALSLAAAILLGISLHTFVPLLFCIYTVVLLRKTARENKGYQAGFYSGILAVVMITAVFTFEWNGITRNLNSLYRKGVVGNRQELPSWIEAAKGIQQGRINEMVLKSGLVYSEPSTGQGNSLWRMPSRNFGEEKVHDPLVMTAQFFSPKIAISETERIRILESLYDARHKAQERLWSGENLQTEHVNTQVKIWPAFHLAYTEKIITVRNTSRRSFNPQEAIYTFHLPEGGVVTALSLWIDGIEEKGILTSKEKADSAYNTIVGIEQRDPSVVRWQEGNTVSVRVFPVNGNETRIFKVGITAPLRKQASGLVYNNIYFDGPSTANTIEDISVDFSQQPGQFEVPASFVSNPSGEVQYSGKYNPGWELGFAEQGFSEGTFSFDGSTYTLSPYKIKRQSAILEEIYLDINSAWTRTEFDSVMHLLKGKTIFVYQNGLRSLNGSNQYQLFETLHRQSFSLFPLHAVRKTDNALLVTKNNPVSPNLDDLAGSVFRKNLAAFLAEKQKIRVFNLGGDLSPYLKSLKEMRVFSYEQGSLQLLGQLVTSNSFAEETENSDHVIIHDAGLSIHRVDGTFPSTAPDHLMRLFSYNHILKELGPGLLDGTFNSEALVEAAQKAVIVSPVSSLVVLEKQADYDRFNIKGADNSLENASMHSKGAVPEPHEWMLIIIAALVLGYTIISPRLKLRVP